MRKTFFLIFLFFTANEAFKFLWEEHIFLKVEKLQIYFSFFFHYVQDLLHFNILQKHLYEIISCFWIPLIDLQIFVCKFDELINKPYKIYYIRKSNCYLYYFFRAIGNMIFTLFWPVFPFLLQIVLISYMVVTAVYPL